LDLILHQSSAFDALNLLNTRLCLSNLAKRIFNKLFLLIIY